MSRTLACLLLAWLLAVPPAAAEPQAWIERADIDFGRLLGDGPFERDFRIRNFGTTPLRIERVELTPPLRLAETRAQIAPGATATLRLVLDASGLAGRYAGTVVVYTNDPTAAELTWTVAGEVVRPIALRPHAQFFLVGVRGEAAETTLEIVNSAAEPLELGPPQHSATRFASRLHTVEPGRRYRLSIALRPDGPPGRQREDITLATSNQTVPVLVIPAYTLLRERVYTFPEAIDLGALPLSAIQGDPALLRHNAQVLMVYQSGGRDFRIAARSDVAGISITAERAAAGDRHQLTIRLDASHATEPRAIRGHVFIDTNDPDFPTLTVPVSGALLAL